jgi:prepilin-type N-terminal cleavage/methylation domain-containing protein
MGIFLRKKEGFTLIELLVALVLTSLLTGAIYNLCVKQVKTYTVNEQVVDMQQNVRAAISMAMREIRMTNFGNVGMILPAQFTVNGQTRTLNTAVNPDTPVTNSVTIITAIEDTTLTGIPASNQITVAAVGNLFNTGGKKYISIGGLESNIIKTVQGNTLTLENDLSQGYPVTDTHVFAIRAITYQVINNNGTLSLNRDENTGDGPQPLADNIENIQFQYLDTNGSDTKATPANTRIIRVAVTAKTNRSDSDYKSGDGYRRRTVYSNIYLRNMGLN